MSDANLFQLGIGLETGAHEEDSNLGRTAVHDSAPFKVVAGTDLFDADREDHFIRDGKDVFAGTHLIIEVVNGTGLDDEVRIQQAFRACVAACGATLLHIHTHKFSPQGVSGVAVLAESHISVHTWPEIGYGAFDVFMCGDAEPWKAVDVLSAAFATDDVRVKEFRRGLGLVEAQQ
ncbi:MAG: adenosylmethionine decarboxylase [Pseudomonadota bacterium]